MTGQHFGIFFSLCLKLPSHFQTRERLHLVNVSLFSFHLDSQTLGILSSPDSIVKTERRFLENETERSLPKLINYLCHENKRNHYRQGGLETCFQLSLNLVNFGFEFLKEILTV